LHLLGLTGGIGMGKSTCAELLRSRAVPVVDTDDLAREVVEPGQPALAQVRSAFGPEIIDANGNLRRDVLAHRVFSDPQARITLENILHPRISELWHVQAQQWRGEGHALAVVVIPLLFETRAEKEFDATVCVACSGPTQTERLRARGWSVDEVAKRIEAQMPVTEKIAKANYLIWTESTLDLHSMQLERILQHFHS
jgi:dephospho-CoA kinase